jgi:predicted nucleic acid-binding protein
MGTLEVIRVVLDTNVLVSGLLFGGTPGKLLDLVRLRQAQNT